MQVSPSRSPQYQLGYAWQCATICMSALLYYGVDSVALSLLIFGCSQIDIVKDKIMSVYPARRRHFPLLLQLTGGVGLSCTCALNIRAEDAQGMQIFSLVVYVCVMLSQLFICCWCGHELTANCEQLHMVLYHCIWYEQDVRFKRDLCFAMTHMRRPLVLRAGHYISVSRQTFVAVLRMSYSYFAELNQVK